jgi:hypothetical protein
MALFTSGISIWETTSKLLSGIGSNSLLRWENSSGLLRHNIVMRRPEKENLQRQCSAAWYEYRKAVEKLNAAGLINPETMTLGQRYLAPITLRQNHLSSSWALSGHLAAHRC